MEFSRPQESPWKSSSIYPHHQSLPTLLFCALTYTSDFTGGCPPPPLSEKELTYSAESHSLQGKHLHPIDSGLVTCFDEWDASGGTVSGS